VPAETSFSTGGYDFARRESMEAAAAFARYGPAGAIAGGDSGPDRAEGLAANGMDFPWADYVRCGRWMNWRAAVKQLCGRCFCKSATGRIRTGR